ncbi:MAG: two-component regulator propeller domain-containing protein [Bacteroidota bacterium]|nr:two-component regulator propeller domain-containing protein [Bacteroidota bacterium]
MKRILCILLLTASLIACEKEYDIYPGDITPDGGGEDDNAEPTSSVSTINILDYFSSTSIYVKDFAFDSQGVVWVATNQGLLKVDEDDNHQIYDTRNTNLLDNYIRYVSIDNEDRIWLVIEDAVCLFSPEQYSCQAFTSDNSEFTSSSSSKVICVDNGGLFLTNSDRVFEYKENTWQIKYDMDDFFDINVYPYTRRHTLDYQDSTFWLISSYGIVAISNDSTAERYHTGNCGISDNDIRGIQEDADGNLWFENDSGLEMYDGISWHLYRDNYNVEVFDDIVICVAGTHSHYTAVWEDFWKPFMYQGTSYPGHYNYAAIDHEGCIWLSYGSVLYKTVLSRD